MQAHFAHSQMNGIGRAGGSCIPSGRRFDLLVRLAEGRLVSRRPLHAQVFDCNALLFPPSSCAISRSM